VEKERVELVALVLHRLERGVQHACLNSELLIIILQALLVGLLISVLLSFLLSKTMINPIEKLTALVADLSVAGGEEIRGLLELFAAELVARGEAFAARSVENVVVAAARVDAEHGE